ARNQPVENCRGERSVPAAIDGDKIRGGWNGFKAIRLSDCSDTVPTGLYFHNNVVQVGLILERCYCCCLRKPVHCEMIPNLVEGFDGFGSAYNIAAPDSGKTIGFRESTHPQDIRAFSLKGRKGRSGPCFAISFIENEQRVFRHAFDEGLDIRTLMPGSHRIIRVG